MFPIWGPNLFQIFFILFEFIKLKMCLVIPFTAYGITLIFECSTILKVNEKTRYKIIFKFER